MELICRHSGMEVFKGNFFGGEGYWIFYADRTFRGALSLEEVNKELVRYRLITVSEFVRIEPDVREIYHQGSSVKKVELTPEGEKSYYRLTYLDGSQRLINAWELISYCPQKLQEEK